MSHKHGVSEIGQTKNVRVAFFLNLSFTIVEIFGGLFTNSVAILSDAVHDLGDTFSLGLAWYFEKKSQCEEDEVFSYGYKRYSILGALINTVVLLVGCSFIIWETIPRLIHPEQVEPKGMIVLALLGIVVNGLAVLQLKKGKSLNEKVVSLHLLEDVLGWVAVLIGSIVMMIWDIPIIDPILSLLIALYILFNIYKNIKSALEVILQKIPSSVDLKQIKLYLNSNKDIEHFYDIHIWSLDGNYNVMTINIHLSKEISLDKIPGTLQKIHDELKPLNIHHCTIEIA